MTQIWRHAVSVVAIGLATAVACWAPVHAHGGGAPQLTGQAAGPYRIYVWSQPDPLRAGETHLTVGVTLPKDGAQARDMAGQDEVPVTDADVLVSYNPADGGAPVVVHATAQRSLGSVYYESDAVLAAPGLWRIDVTVTGSEGNGSASFEAEVAGSRKLNTTLIALAGAMGVFALLWLAIRARRAEASAENPRRKQTAGRLATGTVKSTPPTTL